MQRTKKQIEMLVSAADPTRFHIRLPACMVYLFMLEFAC